MPGSKLPYWEQSDDCRSKPTPPDFRSTLKTTKSSFKRSTPRYGSLKKSHMENIDPSTQPSSMLSSTLLKAYKPKELYSVATVQYPDSTGRSIFNGYHTLETNAGYSRNKLGGFYTK